MSARPDVLVIGGGLLGLLTAAELALRNAKVVLLEAGQAAREASWAGGGILSPLRPWQESAQSWALARFSQRRTAELHQSGILGERVEYWQCGMQILDAGQSEAAWAVEQGLQATVDKNGTNGLWLPETAQLRTPRYGQAALAWARSMGVDVREHHRVVALDTGQGQVTLEQGSMSAAAVCVCAGAWSSRLVPKLAPSVFPVKGQMIALDAGDTAPRHIVQWQSTYLIPRRDGRVLVGSTLEHSEFDQGLSDLARDRLLAAAEQMRPGLASRPLLGHWAGLRPGSADGDPLLGQSLQAPSLWMNTGHYRNGVTQAAGSAQLVAMALSGERLPDWAAALQPGAHRLA